MTKLPAEAYAIVEGRHGDPFHYLGPHDEGGRTVVRAFLPNAVTVLRPPLKRLENQQVECALHQLDSVLIAFSLRHRM